MASDQFDITKYRFLSPEEAVDLAALGIDVRGWYFVNTGTKEQAIEQAYGKPYGTFGWSLIKELEGEENPKAMAWKYAGPCALWIEVE